MHNSADVVVLGAGVIGLMSAIELAQAGLNVRVVERRLRGREASRAAGGILSPLRPWAEPPAIAALADYSQDHFQELATRLRTRTGVDIQWRRCGMLFLDSDEFDAAHGWADSVGRRLDRLQAAEAMILESDVDPGEGEVLHLPDAAQLRNPRLMDALGMMAQIHGIRISEYAGACGLFVRNGRAEGVITENGVIRGDAVLVAAGAWSGYVLAKAGLWCPVVPIRGQMIWYQVEPDMLRHIVVRQDRYLIPRRDGVIIAGSTLEEAGFSKATTREAARDLHLAAARMMPTLNRQPIQGQWSGLRPRAPEGIPFIGPAPVVDRLFLSVGHFRNGLTLAPASARLVADLIIGRSPAVDPSPYDPVRRMAADPQSTYNASA